MGWLGEAIGTYGYAAIFIGCFLEGETILILAAFAAHRGYLSLAGVCLAAFGGTFLGDQIYYFIGRRYGAAFIERRPALRAAETHARRLLDRYGVLFILSFRFLYGLRTVSPVVVGAAGIRVGLYTPLNFAAAAIWTVALAGLGYLFGEGFVAVIERARHYEAVAFGVIACVGAAVWIVFLAKRRRAAHRAGD